MLSGGVRGLAAVVVLGFALAGCGGDPEATNKAKPTVSPEPTGARSAHSSPSDSGGCDYRPAGQPARPVHPPRGKALAGKISLVMATNRGDLDLKLNADHAPCTVTSFVSLAKQGYFDHTHCHRLTTVGIEVLQCGDPTGTGTGGPGYRFDDELTGKEAYPAGTLAMANAGPNTNGSQFFFVYGDTPLPPAYTVFGSIDASSLRILEKVAAQGSDESNGKGDGAPLAPVKISSVTRK